MSADAPAWLAAWRAGQRAVAAPALPQGAAPAPAPPKPLAWRTDGLGYSEPVPWEYDGGRQREPVVDLAFNPPRVVRRVGWCRCLRCRSPFWSEDVVRLRQCPECRGSDERCASTV